MTKKESILFIPGIIAPSKLRDWRYFNCPKLYENSHYHIAKLDIWGTLDKRALEIACYIDRYLANENFHIISHSKGGLDFEHLLKNRKDFESRILSHTSISVPYNGSIIAGFFSLLIIPLIFIPRVYEIYQTLREVYQYRSLNKSYQFNEYCIHANIKRFYKSYPLFWLTYILCYLFEGKNDGFVSKKSAQKGITILELNCDHIEMIGHFYSKRRRKTFESIIHKTEEVICQIN